MTKITTSYLKKYFPLILIVIAATFLRVWNLNSHAIFFGDAAHDLLSAVEAVENKQLPLLGIASSVPRFHQGPLTVWINALVYLVAGPNLLAFSLTFAVISLLALIGLYELVTVHVSQRAALFTTFVFAFSPLAIAHARMPYHITPIPLMTVIFLYSLVRLWQKKKMSVFWSVLAWSLLFQFELAVFPLVFLIPFIIIRTGQKWQNSYLAQTFLAGVIGLAPQIIYDLSHKFEHLGGFALWTGYRLASGTLGGDHQIGFSSIGTVIKTFQLFGGRIFSVDNSFVSMAMISLLFLGIYYSWKLVKINKLPPLIEVVVISTLLLSGAFLIHGGPSEAYFPPFLIFIPIVVGFLLSSLSTKIKPLVWFLLITWATINTTAIFKANFFVSTQHPFNYGYSVGEQRSILGFVSNSTSSDFFFRTTRPAGEFENFFDNLAWLSKEQNIDISNQKGMPIFIEAKDSLLNYYPNMIKFNFESVDVYLIR